jgi:type IV pilus assembly protein PilZ
MGDERRRDERHPMRMRLDYRDSTGGNFLYEYTENFSEGGLFIGTSEPLDEGTEVELRFQPPGVEDVLEVVGKVMWVNPVRPGKDNPNPGMGIQFEDLDDDTKALIAGVVRAIAYL